MDNNNSVLSNPNPGSFMAPAGGGGSALMQAMQRRGISSPSGPNQSVSGGVLPSTPTTQPQPSVMETAHPDHQNAQLVIKAMDSYLKGISKAQHG